jgi:hypothetical protein
MPLAFCYLFLLIFKLEFLTIYPLNFAIETIINVSNYFANFELSSIKTSLISTNSLILIIFGFLWISLWQKNWRLLGIMPIIFGCFLAYKTNLPNLIIDGKSQFFAIYDKNEDLFFSPKTRESLRVNSLIEKFASSKFKNIDEMKNKKVFCEYEYCHADIKNNKILILRERNKITNICQKNYNILVNLSKFELPDCAINNKNIKVINNYDLALEGNYYLFFD